MFPTRVRSLCLVWTTCFHWIGEFYTSYAVSYMLRDIEYGTFLFFGTMTLLGGIFVFFFVPETTGLALEDMDLLFESPGFAWQQMKAYQAARHERSSLVVVGVAPQDQESNQSSLVDMQATMTTKYAEKNEQEV